MSGGCNRSTGRGLLSLVGSLRLSISPSLFLLYGLLAQPGKLFSCIVAIYDVSVDQEVSRFYGVSPRSP